MNDPKRLVGESQSGLAHELLRAAQSEQLPDGLRVRMVEGLALSLGATSLGAGFALSGGALSSGAQTGLAAAQSLGAAAGETSAAAFGATTGGAGVSGLAGASSAGLGGATLAQGTSWAVSATWLKGVLAVCALTGAVGLGSVVKHWAEPNHDTVSSGAAGALSPASSLPGPNAPERVNEEPSIVSPGDAPRAGTDVVSPPSRTTSADNKAARRAERNKSKVTAIEPSSSREVSGDLGREVRMLDAARRAIIDGDIAAAREKLAQYSRAFPRGSLRAEAASLAKAATNAQ